MAETTEESLIKQNERLLTIIEEQQRDLQRLTAKPVSVATVIDITPDSVAIEDGGIKEVGIPSKLKLKPGDLVQLNAMTGQIVAKSPIVPTGMTASVSRILGKEMVEIDTASGKVSLPRNGHELIVGDEVILNPSGRVILERIERPAKVIISEPITWAAIGGNKQAKAAMVEAIEWPIKMASLYKKFGKKPMKGILLYGPPGNGKTMLAKAAAAALSKLHGKAGAESFFAIKGPEVLSKWVGEGEAQVRRLFSHARKTASDNGFPSTLFIDESDSLLSQRGNGFHSATDSIVNQFLVEMDGLEASNTLVILATNRPDMLDNAVVREGRVDRWVEVPSPTKEDATEILSIYFKPLPIEGSCSKDSLIQSIIKTLYEIIPEKVSGALLANVVDRSTSEAIKRSNEGTKYVAGISQADVNNAVQSLCLSRV